MAGAPPPGAASGGTGLAEVPSSSSARRSEGGEEGSVPTERRTILNPSRNTGKILQATQILPVFQSKKN